MNSTHRVLITYPIHRDAVKLLSKHCEVVEISNPTEEVLVERIRGMDAVIIDGEKFSSRVIEEADKLKAIGRFGVGLENIDIEAATRRGIPVTFTPVCCEAVADLTIGLMLCVLRRIAEASCRVKMGKWRTSTYCEELMGHDLYEKTVGIIGLGRIGPAVARRLKGFNVKLLYFDVVRKRDLEEKLGLKYVSLDELLRESDVVTIHTPLTKETREMISEKEFSSMKSRVVIINTARGPIIDENSLYNSLLSGKVAGAGLDVLSVEPTGEENPLFELENVVITPHIGTTTHETRRRMAMDVVEDVLRVLRGVKPKYLVNPEVLKQIKMRNE